MKRKIYKLLSSAIRCGGQRMLALALIVLAATGYSQVTHTLNYTGSVQTINLQPGIYQIECWGADGGSVTANTALPGKGGYSKGSITLSAPTTYSVYVGGKGNGGAQPLGGFNSGNGITKTNVTTATGGGGGSDVRVLVDDFFHRIIVAGGGGGQGNTSGAGGNGGGLIGQNGLGTTNAGVGGSQTTPGAYPGGGDSKPAVFGEGSDGPAGTTGGQGGGGWYGGSFGTRTNGGGAGGSGYVLTSSSFIPVGYFSAAANYYFTNTVTLRADEPGFVANPVVTGDGLVLIKELCNISLTASGTNSLNPSICAGQNVTLTTDGISNYVWSTGNTTNSTIVVSPMATTVYTLSATSSSNCTAAKSITVTVSSALPVLTITNTPNSICLGKTATLTAGGALTYTWAGGPGGVQNGQTFTPTATSGYTVTGQNGCGQSTASTTITIAPLAVSVASSSNNICSGSSAILTATAAVTGFTWMPGGMTGTNVMVSPLVNTVYTLTASDGTCTGVATLSLDTKPIPTLAIVATATDICEGSAATLTVTGANTYTWVTPASNLNIITVNPTSATSYVVSGTNASNCTSATSQIVVTKPNPVVNVSTNKPIVCEAGSATLTASGGAVSFSWVNGPATNTNVVNPIVSSTYTVTGTGANNCTTDKTITVNVLAVSVAASSTSMTICSGQSAVLNASGATSYTWVGIGNFANATVSPTLTTTYSVNANTTSSGLTCPSSNSIIITVNALPTVSVSATKTNVCRKDANVIITATGASTYSWSPTLLTNTISVHPQSTTTYSVTGTDANGCQNVASVQIVVSPCTGIDEFTSSGKTISVYPNPSNGEFTVSCESDITLKVINELGQQIQTISLDSKNDHKISVTGLANGIYFIIGQNDTEKVNQKIVVNK